MKQVNIHEAKTQFSKLVQAASEGKTTIIARAGKPIAKIVPLKEKTLKPRKLGILKDKITLPDNLEDFKIPDDVMELMIDPKIFHD